MHWFQVDDRAGKRDVKWRIAARAEDGELDGCTRRTAHSLNRFIKRSANNQLAIQMRDEVTGLDASLVGGGIFCRSDDFNSFVLKRYRQPKTAIFAVNLRLQRAEIGTIKEPAMGIKACQHPLNRAFHQFLVVNLVDIARLDLAIDGEKFVEILDLLRLQLLLLHILRNKYRAGHSKRDNNGKG